MKKSLFLSVFVMIVSAQFALGADTLWPKEPKDFRGVPFGATEDEAKVKIPSLSCKDSKLGRTCFDLSFRVGEVLAGCSIGFTDGKMNSAYMRFDSKDYKFIKSVFIEKFGDPMNSDNGIVKTRMGVEYENEKLRWTGDIIILTLEKYCSTINHGCANYTSKDKLKKFIEEKEKGKKDAVKDF